MKNICVLFILTILSISAMGAESYLPEFSSEVENISLEKVQSTMNSSNSILSLWTDYICVMSATVEIGIPGLGALQVTVTVEAADCIEAAKELKKGLLALIIQ